MIFLHMDDAQPVGNGIAALVLAKLAHLFGESDYLHASEKTLKAAYPQIKEYPTARASMLLALKENISPGLQIVIRGDSDEIYIWQRLARQHAGPGKVFCDPEYRQRITRNSATKRSHRRNYGLSMFRLPMPRADHRKRAINYTLE